MGSGSTVDPPAKNVEATSPATEDVRNAEDAGEQHRSQATRLVGLSMEGTNFFHSPNMDAYADVDLGDHRETLVLRSREFRRWIVRRFYEQHKRTPSAPAVTDALGVLEGLALYDGQERAVFTRLGEHDGSFYLDLGDPLWKAVKIDSNGWKIVGKPFIRFRRPRGMVPLPLPVRGGTLDDLRRFVNVASEEDWILLVAWLLGALYPHGPYPVLILHGEQGSAKSTTAHVLKKLVDPNAAPLRSEPRDTRDLMIAAKNGWVLAFDNLSYLHPWLSDDICRLATGGGFATRELYSDAEEVIFEAKRPVILNGIEEIATRSDLLDRAIIVELPQIPDDRRRDEKAFWGEFEKARPRILGALLDGVSSAIRAHPGTTLKTMPRLADFAIWVTAAEAGLGWPPGAFLRAYTDNRASSNSLVLDSSPIAWMVRSLAAPSWSGTSTDLFMKLNTQAAGTVRQKGWPQSARALSGALKRLTPNLRAVDIDVSFSREPHTGRRLITVKKISIPMSPSSPAQAPKKRVR